MQYSNINIVKNINMNTDNNNNLETVYYDIKLNKNINVDDKKKIFFAK